jgi:uncharacterized protein YecT (DUF1311 family)
MIALVIAFATATANPATDWNRICSSGGGMDAYACAEHHLEGIERRLATVYRKTLSTLPDQDDWDKRKTRAQLVKAQKAWASYRDANCDFQGGLEGGAPQWVSTFSTECKIAETKKRIAYLKHYADPMSRN